METGIINFHSLLLQKYVLLGIDEIDVVILLHIDNLLRKKEKVSPGFLKEHMQAEESTVNEHLLKLINNQFITLSLKGKKEVYSISATFQKLSDIMEEEDKKISFTSQINDDIKQVVATYEQEFHKLPSAIDLELIRKWICEDKFSVNKISSAIMTALKNKKTSLQFVDVLLNKKEETSFIKDDGELESLFNQIYGKIK